MEPIRRRVGSFDSGRAIMAARVGAARPHRRRSAVGVYIIREMVGTSPRSWSDAARQAVATASKTVRNIQTVEVVKSTAVVQDGEIVEYRVELKIGFEYEG
jgi:flavin-binding protein dodecin